MTTQITPIPQWVFNAKMPDSYDPKANFSQIQATWDSIPREKGELGQRLQIYVIAYFMGITKIEIYNTDSLNYLADKGILDSKRYQPTPATQNFLYHMVTEHPENIPNSVFDLEFYKEQKPKVARWLEKKIRRHNGEYTSLEKLGQALLALPGATVRFVKDRVSITGQFKLLKNESGKLIGVEHPEVKVATPEINTSENGKKSLSWPALDKGDNLLAPPPEPTDIPEPGPEFGLEEKNEGKEEVPTQDPEATPHADDTTPVKEDVEVVEEAPAPAPVEEPKGEEAPPKTKRKPRKSAASKKTAGKGPKRGPDGRFLKKEETPPEHHFRSTGGGSGGGTGC